MAIHYRDIVGVLLLMLVATGNVHRTDLRSYILGVKCCEKCDLVARFPSLFNSFRKKIVA